MIWLLFFLLSPRNNECNEERIRYIIGFLSNNQFLSFFQKSRTTITLALLSLAHTLSAFQIRYQIFELSSSIPIRRFVHVIAIYIHNRCFRDNDHAVEKVAWIIFYTRTIFVTKNIFDQFIIFITSFLRYLSPLFQSLVSTHNSFFLKVSMKILSRRRRYYTRIIFNFVQIMHGINTSIFILTLRAN